MGRKSLLALALLVGAALPVVGTTADPTISLTVDDVSVDEGASGEQHDVLVSMHLAAPAPTAFDVYVADVSGSALAPKDYRRKTGPIRFAKGTTLRRFAVRIIGDDLREGDETFTIVASEVDGTVLDSGTVTIVDDDGPSALTVTASAALEDDDVVTRSNLTFTLDSPVDRDVTVSWLTVPGTAVPSKDYYATGGQILMRAGQRVASRSVAIRPDQAIELDETFDIQVAIVETDPPPPPEVTVATPSLTITIEDDDAPERGPRTLVLGQWFQTVRTTTLLPVMQQTGIDRLQMNVPTLNPTLHQPLTAFIQQLHAAGITVEARVVDPSWALNPSAAVAWTQSIVAFNATSAHDFDGIHLNVPSWSLPGDQAQLAIAWGSMVQQVNAVRDLPLGVSFPSSADGNTPGVPNYFPVLDGMVDSVILDVYAEQASGAGGIIEQVASELEQVETFATGVDVTVGVHLDPVPAPFPETLTFAEESIDHLSLQTLLVDGAYADSTRYTGVSFTSWSGLEAILIEEGLVPPEDTRAMYVAGLNYQPSALAQLAGGQGSEEIHVAVPSFSDSRIVSMLATVKSYPSRFRVIAVLTDAAALSDPSIATAWAQALVAYNAGPAPDFDGWGVHLGAGTSAQWSGARDVLDAIRAVPGVPIASGIAVPSDFSDLNPDGMDDLVSRVGVVVVSTFADTATAIVDAIDEEVADAAAAGLTLTFSMNDTPGGPPDDPTTFIDDAPNVLAQEGLAVFLAFPPGHVTGTVIHDYNGFFIDIVGFPAPQLAPNVPIFNVTAADIIDVATGQPSSERYYIAPVPNPFGPTPAECPVGVQHCFIARDLGVDSRATISLQPFAPLDGGLSYSCSSFNIFGTPMPAPGTSYVGECSATSSTGITTTFRIGLVTLANPQDTEPPMIQVHGENIVDAGGAVSAERYYIAPVPNPLGHPTPPECFGGWGYCFLSSDLGEDSFARFTVTAIDAVSGPVPAACYRWNGTADELWDTAAGMLIPEPGTSFAGQCYATDAAGNTAMLIVGLTSVAP